MVPRGPWPRSLGYQPPLLSSVLLLPSPPKILPPRPLLLLYATTSNANFSVFFLLGISAAPDIEGHTF